MDIMTDEHARRCDRRTAQREKLLKQLNFGARNYHRAEAAVLIRSAICCQRRGQVMVRHICSEGVCVTTSGGTAYLENRIVIDDLANALFRSQRQWRELRSGRSDTGLCKSTYLSQDSKVDRSVC